MARGSRTPKGYLKVRVAKYNLLGHRVAWEVSTGRRAGSSVVHHKCGTPSCINPEHLELATHAENIGEMFARQSLLARIAELEAALRDAAPSHPLVTPLGIV